MLEYKVVNLGVVSFQNCFSFQMQMFDLVGKGLYTGVLILCEHPHTITVGRSGSKDNILVSQKTLEEKGISVYEVDRGGDVTYHGPGQLLIYPILNLRFLKQDIHWYLRTLEEIIIEFLEDVGIFAKARPGLTGVWVGEKKIASIGIGIKKWITYHGVAININTDLTYFDYIHPCGFREIRMTSMSKLLNENIAMQLVKQSFIKKFEVLITDKTNLTNITSAVGGSAVGGN